MTLIKHFRDYRQCFRLSLRSLVHGVLMILPVLAVSLYPLNTSADERVLDESCEFIENFERTPLTDWIELQLLSGMQADLRAVSCEGQLCGLGSNEPSLLNNHKLLEEGFLYHLLSDVHISAINIVGAHFQNPVCVTDREVSKRVSLTHSRFSDRVTFRNTEFHYDLIVDGSFFESDFLLSGATVRGQLSARASHVDRTFNMRHAVIGQDLHLHESENVESGVDLPERFRTVIGGEFIANSAVVEGEFVGDYAHFKGKVNMQFLSVGEDLNFRHGARFLERIDLRSSRVNGRMGFSGAEVAGLDLTNSSIGDSLILCEIRSPGDAMIDLRHTKIGNDFDLRGSIIKGSVNARRLKVSGDLMLDYAGKKTETCDKVTAQKQGRHQVDAGGINKIILQDAQVAVVHDGLIRTRELDSVKGNKLPVLEIDGLHYSKLHDDSLGKSGSSSGYYVDWLSRDTTFTAQPYHHLASQLRKDGAYSAAAEVLFEARKRERTAVCNGNDITSSLSGCAGMWLLEIGVGYGIGVYSFLALFWVVAFSCVGALIIRLTSDKSLWWSTWASLDYMLPLVELNSAHRKHIEENLPEWAQSSLYVQALSGWLLASFVVAAVAGLTQGT
ncbi:hypothetical protein EYC98_16665 [Halieaceae bacterium IMCC14734]|uniref:Membrane-associated oxidoreductase n=1 Tax=Candidatus Litorirhabdus singularis TaxID=2518993 RepID=A0ABT3TJK1_9GAMM|nr:hypothetical protein [Candidatus Litorirhabdus singularis]MCX2982496.1 hypothetical protein [Candidatus Litorirhabdus singularis]